MNNGKKNYEGVLAINKPVGITSHDVVAHIRKLLTKSKGMSHDHQRRFYGVGLPAEVSPKSETKVGHTGTLDPFATGLLLVLLGPATRLMEYAHTLSKTYEAQLALGATSDTDDPTGNITPTPPPHTPTRKEVQQVLQQHTGTQQQIPPTYAAIKVQGKKLYEYAREHKHVERKPRTITVEAIICTSYNYPELHLTITCSAGTYIRALARDIGQNLGTGAYLSALHRTAIGPFTSKNAVGLERLTHEILQEHLQPPRALVAHLPSINVNDKKKRDLQQGRTIQTRHDIPENQPIAILDATQNLIGIGLYDPTTTQLRPDKIFQRQ